MSESQSPEEGPQPDADELPRRVPTSASEYDTIRKDRWGGWQDRDEDDGGDD